MEEADEKCSSFCDKTEKDNIAQLSVGEVFRRKFMEYLEECQSDSAEVRELKTALFYWHLRLVSFLQYLSHIDFFPAIYKIAKTTVAITSVLKEFCYLILFNFYFKLCGLVIRSTHTHTPDVWIFLIRVTIYNTFC